MSDFEKLREAVERLYYSAHWIPDRDVDAKRLWEDVRDAAKLEPGQTSKILNLE